MILPQIIGFCGATCATAWPHATFGFGAHCNRWQLGRGPSGLTHQWRQAVGSQPRLVSAAGVQEEINYRPTEVQLARAHVCVCARKWIRLLQSTAPHVLHRNGDYAFVVCSSTARRRRVRIECGLALEKPTATAFASRPVLPSRAVPVFPEAVD